MVQDVVYYINALKIHGGGRCGVHRRLVKAVLKPTWEPAATGPLSECHPRRTPAAAARTPPSFSFILHLLT